MYLSLSGLWTYTTSRDATFKTHVLDAVQAALAASGVPEADRFQRVFELDAENFWVHATFPDAAMPRGDDALLIEIL